MLPKTRAYVKSYNGRTNWMYLHWCVFLIEDDDLLEEYNTNSDKFSADIKNDFIANLLILKNWWWINRLLRQKISRVDSSHTCLAVINLGSAFNKDGNYYSLLFLKECKYI